MLPLKNLTNQRISYRLILTLLVTLGLTFEIFIPLGSALAEPEGDGVIFLPTIVKDGASSERATADWLAYINYHRSLANLPPVVEQTDWSLGGENHSLYTVKNDVLMHDEDKNNPYYTVEGQAAARAGNLMASGNNQLTDRYAIDSWMQAPFHALGILDPQLLRVGYGSYRESDGGLQMSATLDVLRGIGNTPGNVRFPVKWPADGKTIALRTHGSEVPNPLTSCSGYKAPVGLPVLLQIGTGDQIPKVSAYSFRSNGKALESCVFTETTYTNPDKSMQDLGRAILNSRDAVVLVPRQQLEPGAKYTVSITVNGQTHTWSFSVSK